MVPAAQALTTSSDSVDGLGECGTVPQDYPTENPSPTRERDGLPISARGRRLLDGGGLGGPVLPDTHPVRRHIAFKGPPEGAGMGKGDRHGRFVHMPSRACRLNLRGGEVERGSYVKYFASGLSHHGRYGL